MSNDIEEIARRLGAKIVGTVPHTGGGAPGAWHLGKIYEARMEELRQQEQARARQQPPSTLHHLELPISETTAQTLAEIARIVSTSEQPLTSVQIAERLLSCASKDWLDAWRKINLREEELKAQLATGRESSME